MSCSRARPCWGGSTHTGADGSKCLGNWDLPQPVTSSSVSPSRHAVLNRPLSEEQTVRTDFSSQKSFSQCFISLAVVFLDINLVVVSIPSYIFGISCSLYKMSVLLLDSKYFCFAISSNLKVLLFVSLNISLMLNLNNLPFIFVHLAASAVFL